jgi:serine protease AprX
LAEAVAEKVVCPLCGDSVRVLVSDYVGSTGSACTRCIDEMEAESLRKRGLLPQSVLRTVGESFTVFPTPLRLNANPHFTGRGVTICFIDSGFHAHPDLLYPANRIVCAVDIARGGNGLDEQPEEERWHGTMTSVVCAGNGFLSDGYYRGVASNARVVLLKVENEGHITGENIAKAIRWAIENRERYSIRIINLSVADDDPVSYKESQVDQAVEDAIRAGIVVVAAVGNDPTESVKPPANSPNVIAVGGVDDHNTLDMLNESLYHSTYGVTVDQLLKPELIAPSIWVAAPILPMTKPHDEAKALHSILTAHDRDVKAVAVKGLGTTGLAQSLVFQGSLDEIRDVVRQRMGERKFISAHYMHADGTSFAAPIVCSVIAQMLEANPGLTPAAVRHILLTTTRKLEHVPIERQGYGVINPRAAVAASLTEKHVRTGDFPNSPVVDRVNRRILFYYHNDEAHSVVLSGSFNGWSTNSTMFIRNGRGIWKAELPMLPPGRYHYKFVVDNKAWIPDPENVFREPDGFNGLNSWFTLDE